MYIQTCRSPQERELATIIEDRGGPEAVRRDKRLLREVFDTRVNGAGISGLGRRGSDGAVDEFEELQEELQEDVPTTIRENMAQFQAKFTIQARQLEDLQRTVRQESNRIVAAVTAGPHEKIIDPVSRPRQSS